MAPDKRASVMWDPYQSTLRVRLIRPVSGGVGLAWLMTADDAAIVQYIDSRTGVHQPRPTVRYTIWRW